LRLDFTDEGVQHFQNAELLFVLGYDRIQWVPQLVRHAGVDHLEEFVLHLVLLLQHLLGDVDELQDGLVFPVAMVGLDLDLDVPPSLLTRYFRSSRLAIVL